MVRRVELVSALCAFAAVASIAQTPPQDWARQREAERRAEQQRLQTERQHQAQLDQIREIDRQQARQERQEAEQQRVAQAATEQQLLIQRQQAEQLAQVREQSQAEPQPPVQLHQVASQPQPQMLHTPSPRWSLRNISGIDKAGIAALAVLLVALAFPAGIIPVRRIRR